MAFYQKFFGMMNQSQGFSWEQVLEVEDGLCETIVCIAICQSSLNFPGPNSWRSTYTSVERTAMFLLLIKETKQTIRS